MADRPLPYRKLIQILKRFNVREDKRRGKGSERMLVAVIDGRTVRFPIRCHKESEVKPRAVVRAVRRRFNLTEEDGVSDGEFYS
jgi:hypothetical protein